MLVVCIYTEVVGRVWCMWLAPEASRVRVQRANRLILQSTVVLTKFTLRVFAARLDVHGEVPTGRFIVVSNHQSIADIAILSSVLRNLNLKFVAKDGLGRRVPAVSLVLNHWGSVLISRDGTRHDVRQLRVMARGLAHWEGSAVVFPEGTRSRDGRILPYKAAAVRIVAEATDLPILPVAIDGTHSVSDLIGFAGHMNGAHGTLTIGRPIPSDQWRGRIDEVVDEIRDWACHTITALRDPSAASRPVGHRDTVSQNTGGEPGPTAHPTN